MIFTTRFDLGQTIYGIANVPESVFVPCAFCATGGRITGANGVSKVCPECYGKRGRDEWLPTAWRVDPRDLTVGQVRVAATCSSGLDDEDVFDNYKAQADWSEEYMLVETGVGSGQVWRVADLFASRGEAENACRERNTIEAGAAA